MASPYKQLAVEQIRSLDFNSVLMAWQEAAADADAAKQREHELRLLAFQKGFPNPQEGTNNRDLGNKWLLKADHKFNYKVANTTEMKSALVQLPGELPQRLVRFKPELSITEWRKMAEEVRQKFERFVTVTPGMPTLSILEPGAEGNKV